MQTAFKILIDNIPPIGFVIFVTMVSVVSSCVYSFGTEKLEGLLVIIKNKVTKFKRLFITYIFFVLFLTISHMNLWLLFHFLSIGLALILLISVSEVSLQENLEILGWQKNYTGHYIEDSKTNIVVHTAGTSKYIPKTTTTLEKEQYLEKLKIQLDNWQSEVDQLQAKAEDASADLKVELEEQIANLKVKFSEGEGKFNELTDATEEAWEELKDDAEYPKTNIKVRTAASKPKSLIKTTTRGKKQYEKSPSFTLVEVFYGTDRRREDIKQPSKFYGSKRGTLEYGVCEVSIPRIHEQGELEGPFEFISIRIGDFDDKKHVVLKEVNPITENIYFKNLSDRINKSPKKQAFVFIHGYNVTFEDAARRTAQIAYDMGFNDARVGAPIFYSWPSQGKPITPEFRLFKPYTIDEGNNEWSETNLEEFLLKISTKTKAKMIHLIAHSMGNRALTKVLRKFANESKLSPLFKEIVLAAPDIDAEIFKRDILPKIVDKKRRITLYASSNDKALKESKKVHEYSRAGDLGQELILFNGMETIDASEVDTDFTGHSYNFDNPIVINDLALVINQHLPPGPGGRNLLELKNGRAKYWKFRS